VCFCLKKVCVNVVVCVVFFRGKIVRVKQMCCDVLKTVKKGGFVVCKCFFFDTVAFLICYL
jgi:hypothetical protein